VVINHLDIFQIWLDGPCSPIPPIDVEDIIGAPISFNLGCALQVTPMNPRLPLSKLCPSISERKSGWAQAVGPECVMPQACPFRAGYPPPGGANVPKAMVARFAVGAICI